MDKESLTAYEIRKKVAAGEISPTEIVEELSKRIEKRDGKIKAFLSVNKEAALERAGAVEEKLSRGEKLGSLGGVPVAIKDNMCVKGQPATCASKILEGYLPPYNAYVVERLLGEDAIILGKTNMDEFAMGSSTENSAFATTRNPWDTERVPGGSSGGSAAAVAAGEAVCALGSDTGGSIRQPAALCGVVGLKPTYGRVSRYGLVAFASSLDQIGPFTKDVRDAALLLEVIAGKDEQDSTSVDFPVPDYLATLNDDIKGLRLGVPREYFGEGLDVEVEKAIEEAVEIYKSLGAEIKEISLPHTEYAVATYYLVATAEASSNLARYDGVHYGYRNAASDNIIEMYSRTRAEGFGDEVKRRIMLGTYALSAGYYDAYYLKALKVRALIKGDFDEAFKSVDLILSPTSPTAAFKMGEKTQDPLMMYLSDIYTISANLAGISGISIPCGFTRAGLPVGLQIMGRAFEEEVLLRAARALEKEAKISQVPVPEFLR
jgi:aspartyl-tRNA(Asn)/glutamyl-tRNA(Gln) amidotransferase subunit A